MSQQLYILMLAMVDAWQQQDSEEIDSEDSGSDLSSITARLGQFKNTSARSANDAALAAALLILVFIYAWNCVKYRASLREIDQNGVIYLQNKEAAFLTPGFSESLAIQWLHQTGRLFLDTDNLCQMNSTLTGSQKRRA